jgi:transposase
MTISDEKAAEIRRLHYSEKWRLHTVADQLHVHVDVVRRVVGLTAPSPHSRPRIDDMMAIYADFVEETIKQYPRLRSTRIYDMLLSRGFSGSPRTVRRYLQKVRPKMRGEVCLRPQPLIGEQSQIDWMHVGPVSVGSGAVRQLWAFVMVLSHSRSLWAELLFDLTAEGVRRSLLRGCSYFGGTTRQWLFDNPKTVVLERYGQSCKFHPLLLEVASELHVQPRLCAVRHPQSKGRVERAVRYLRDRFLDGRTISSLTQGTEELNQFLVTIAPKRPHPEMMPSTVADVFAQEQARLLPLPTAMPPLEALFPAKVSKYGLVAFDGNRYSVPAEVGVGSCSIAADDVTVRVLVNHQEVSRHPRCWNKRQVIEKHEHRQELAKRRPLGQPNTAQHRLRALVPDIDRLFERWLEAGRNMGSMTTQTIKLLDLYGDDTFRQAAEKILVSDRHDPGALALVCDQIRKAHKKSQPAPISLPEHVVDRHVEQHNLENYDV